jgi:hypothetical protein
MNCKRKHTDLIGVISVFAVKIVKVVSPQILDITRVDPAVAVGGIFDEHHGRKAIKLSGSFTAALLNTGFNIL